MDNLGDRLKALRKAAGFSQTALAGKIGVSYSQYGRYELKGVQPPANILNKLADILNTSVDYLVSGDSDEKARITLNDVELLQQFKAVQQMTEEDKRVIKTMIDAFITKRKVQQLAL